MPVPECSLQVVYKIASNCNLDCSYCYVYNKGDDSWRRRPATTAEALATREALARACASLFGQP